MTAGWCEKEGKRRDRRERVFRATLSARMRVEQSTKRDRTRNQFDLERGDSVLVGELMNEV